MTHRHHRARRFPVVAAVVAIILAAAASPILSAALSQTSPPETIQPKTGPAVPNNTSTSASAPAQPAPNASSPAILTGAERTSEWLPLLKGARVAVLANHTSVAAGGEHLVDLLVRSGVALVGILSPEHGFRGDADAGAGVGDSVDAATGIPVWSLYGSQRLSDERLRSFDVLVVDMQDVGLRFYTYYITMLEAMDMCAASGARVIVLDRPNPNGMYVDGPLLDMRLKSGVGALPIPVVHGLTMGEIASMAVGEGWVKRVALTVVRCEGYTHRSRYTVPVAPSPNLRTQHAIYLYPSVCLFEGTVCSLGRGTDFPFEVYGHPAMQGCRFSFTPRPVAGARKPPLLDRECFGVDLRGIPDDEIIAAGFDLSYIIDAYRRTGLGERFFTPFFDKLTGADYVRRMIIDGASAAEIRVCWQDDLEKYRRLRRKYLLYPE